MIVYMLRITLYQCYQSLNEKNYENKDLYTAADRHYWC